MSIRSFRSFSVLLAPIFALALATPAMAQGVVSPPDDSGPGPADYTGFTILYLINGVWRDTADGQETEIICTNVGKTEGGWAVQVFNSLRTLTCESTGTVFSSVGDSENFRTDSFFDDFSLAGTCPNEASAAARIIVDPNKPTLVCTARIVDATTRIVAADIPVTPVGKAPKIKIK